jgi:hypothetical protein
VQGKREGREEIRIALVGVLVAQAYAAAYHTFEVPKEYSAGVDYGVVVLSEIVACQVETGRNLKGCDIAPYPFPDYMERTREHFGMDMDILQHLHEQLAVEMVELVCLTVTKLNYDEPLKFQQPIHSVTEAVVIDDSKIR